MNLKRGSVLSAFLCSLVFVGTVEAQSQGVPGRLASLQGQLEQALANLKQLQAALASEAMARQAADQALQASINTGSGGGVTQAALDAAIASESLARSAADASLEGQIANEAAARSTFDATLAPLTALAPLATHVSVEMGSLDGLAGPHVIFTGANVHIRSGHVSRDSFTKNGRGNLIVGYNEVLDPSLPAERGGSHNLVVGAAHRYNFGVGLVFGYANRLGDDGASVSGGALNAAEAMFSSVSAGRSNRASGFYSSVSGGDSNIASGNTAVVSAGVENKASGDLSSVLGGMTNEASGYLSTVGGGANLTNGAMFTFVP